MDARLPFGWREYLLKAGAQLSPWRATLRLTHLALVQGSWLLDELVAPGWRNAGYRGPLFIVGHQRSGTTALHRALCSGPGMLGASLGDLLLPTVSARVAARLARAADGALGGRAGAWADRLEERLFGELDPVHRIRFAEVEEEEFLFWTVFASGMCANDSPASLRERRLDHLRTPGQWPQSRRERLWAWYESCLKKRSHGHERPWLVVKNPPFSQRLPELVARFPGARFVLLNRDPLQAIPSRLNLVETIWRAAGRRQTSLQPHEVEVFYRDSVRTYLAIERDFDAVPADRRLSLSSERCARDLSGCVAEVREAFALPDDTEVRLPPAAVARGRGKRSLADFGLSEARVQNDLAPVMAARRWQLP